MSSVPKGSTLGGIATLFCCVHSLSGGAPCRLDAEVASGGAQEFEVFDLRLSICPCFLMHAHGLSKPLHTPKVAVGKTMLACAVGKEHKFGRWHPELAVETVAHLKLTGCLYGRSTSALPISRLTCSLVPSLGVSKLVIQCGNRMHEHEYSGSLGEIRLGKLSPAISRSRMTQREAVSMSRQRNHAYLAQDIGAACKP